MKRPFLMRCVLNMSRRINQANKYLIHRFFRRKFLVVTWLSDILCATHHVLIRSSAKKHDLASGWI